MLIPNPVLDRFRRYQTNQKSWHKQWEVNFHKNRRTAFAELGQPDPNRGSPERAARVR